MTDVSTMNNINNVYDYELLLLLLFFYFSTYFARKRAYFCTKIEIYNGKINKSYDIMYGKRFILKNFLLYC